MSSAVVVPAHAGSPSRKTTAPKAPTGEQAAAAVLSAVTGTEVSVSAVHQVITAGNLAELSPSDKIRYYMEACRDLGLNWRTKPFIISRIGQGGEQLYLTAEGAEQLAALHNVSILEQKSELVGTSYRVQMTLGLPNGRRMIKTGAISIKGLHDQALENAIMKAETKAFRRGVRALVGLNTWGTEAANLAMMGWGDDMTAAELAAVTITAQAYDAGDPIELITPEEGEHVDQETGEILDADEPPISSLGIAKRRLWTMAQRRGLNVAELIVAAGLCGVELDAATEEEVNKVVLALLDNPDARMLVAASGQLAVHAAENA